MAGRIVVGVDDSEHAAAALRWAVAEAELRDVTVEAIHVWNYVPTPSPADAGLVPLAWSDDIGIRDATRDAAERMAHDLVERVVGRNGRVHVSIVEGDPALALVDAADGADLLVVGNRGRGSIAQALLGS